MKRIAVIGGGAAGLAAAWRLSSAGASVTVFEKAADVGGRMRSETLDGCVIDTGAQLFGNGFSALFGLAREVRGESLLARSPGHDGVYRNGRIHPITYGSVPSMVTSSALPATLKFKLGAKYVPFLLRHAGSLNAGDLLASGGDALDTESVAEWGRRELGDDFVELLAYPLLGAYYGSTPERTSIALYHALAKAGLDVSVYGVRGGTNQLTRVIAAALEGCGVEIRRTMDVQRVAAEGDGVLVDDERFDAAVLAVPAPVVTQVIEVAAALREWIARVEFTPSAVLAVLLNRSVGTRLFGISMLRREVDDVVAICIAENKLAGLVARDRGLLVCLSAPQQSAALVSDPQHAVQRMLDAVEHVLPGTRHDVLRVKLYRHQYGYPIFYPGYIRHLRQFPHDALPGNIRLAGDYLVSPTVDGAIRSGERAARGLLAQERESA